MRRILVLPAALCALAIVLACAGSGRTGPASTSTAVEDEASDALINATELRRDLFAFADDSMRGRETGTPDAFRAARFLADRVRRLGLEPAGDSLYFQRVPLQRQTFAPSTRVEVRDGDRVTSLRIGRDVVPLLELGQGIPPTRRTADGAIVFVGYGLGKATGQRDDLAGLPLENKVVVVINGAPEGSSAATRARLESQSAISDRLARIMPQHPAAVVVLLAGKGRALFDQLAPELERAVSLRSSKPDLPEEEREIPMLLLGTPTAGSPLLPAGWPADERPQVLPGRLIARLDQRRDDIVEYNVVAAVRGSDPRLQSTYVAYGAHYDHIGVVAPVRGDSIANGADDDGSGSVALLAIARAMQHGPVRPRRSMLFVWHVGEEKGLLGSSWFVNHPTVPIDSIVAELNADMIGRNAPDLLYLVGPRVSPNNQSRRLGALVDSVNAAEPMPFRVDRTFDAASHPEHIYERSDHFNYARKGIPIVFFTTGLHAEYHQPGDEASKIDFVKLARVSQLLLDVGRAVGNATARPR
jgi:hypothetical protein